MSDQLILTLCEIALNVLRGTIPLNNAQFRRLKKRKEEIKYAASKKINVERKKRMINQRGGFQGQGFFICHIIVIQGITRSEMQSNQVRSVTVQNNKNTNYISNITQGHTYGKKRRNKNKMCNEIKKCKTIRCAKNNKMCKRQ